MKEWKDMTPKEKAAETYKEIQRRKALKLKGQQQADNFKCEQAAKASKRKRKSSIYRGNEY